MAVLTISEEWRPLKDWPLYEVSNLGRVRRKIGGSGTRAGKILKGAYSRSRVPYHVVNLFNGTDASGRVEYVHDLVCRAFHGSKPSPRHQVAHWDGDHENNRWDNLRWVTPLENSVDSIRLGRQARGSRLPQAKLREGDIPQIRDLLADGVLQKDIAAKFGVSESTISEIKHRRKWTHV